VTIRPDVLTDEEKEIVTALEKAAAGSVGCRGGAGLEAAPSSIFLRTLSEEAAAAARVVEQKHKACAAAAAVAEEEAAALRAVEEAQAAVAAAAAACASEHQKLQELEQAEMYAETVKLRALEETCKWVVAERALAGSPEAVDAVKSAAVPPDRAVPGSAVVSEEGKAPACVDAAKSAAAPPGRAAPGSAVESGECEADGRAETAGCEEHVADGGGVVAGGGLAASALRWRWVVELVRAWIQRARPLAAGAVVAARRTVPCCRGARTTCARRASRYVSRTWCAAGCHADRCVSCRVPDAESRDWACVDVRFWQGWGAARAISGDVAFL